MSGSVLSGQLTRLKSRKSLDQLFKTKPKFSKELRFHFIAGGEFHLAIAVSAPKRNFKRAVDRNRIKRVMREAIRLEYQEIQGPLNGEGLFIYSGKDLPTLVEMRKQVGKLLRHYVEVTQPQS